MKRLEAKVEFVDKIKSDVFLLMFKSGYIAKSAKAGQFLQLKVDKRATILRRPLSIHKINGSSVYILFRTRGRGTLLLSRYRAGDALDIIGPLGKGFTAPSAFGETSPLRGGHPTSCVPRILVAGGLGVAPLLFLAQKIRHTEDRRQRTEDRKEKHIVLLGAKSKKEVLAESEFKKLGFKTLVATDDGSRGFKGTVTELLKKQLSAISRQPSASIYACGPKEMFSEIKKIIEPYPQVSCQVSFEQFMGCGLGVCCGCAIETTGGYKKVCKDGPVFDLQEIK
ncbi:MAG: dihydroorotate dehydrogenase electron transfer subunit [Candidatus Omnitrophica bacterium]|nr:dihydroorotate dehydrogenase electron transfer subunit [Candidatus Omnitrophota bacterium]